MKSLLEKIDKCHSNPEKLSTTKINKHTASGYFLFTYCLFYTAENKFDHYRGRERMKDFFRDLRKHATKIISHEIKEILPLTTDEIQSYYELNICYICLKEFSTNHKKYYKVRDHCHYTGNVEALFIMFVI